MAANPQTTPEGDPMSIIQDAIAERYTMLIHTEIYEALKAVTKVYREATHAED